MRANLWWILAVGQEGGHRVLPQKLFAVVVPEALGPEVLRAEAGVGGGDEVLHSQALHPLAWELGLAEREPEWRHRTPFANIRGLKHRYEWQNRD